VTPLSRQPSQPLLYETIARRRGHERCLVAGEALSTVTCSTTASHPLSPLLPENWSPNWAALSTPILTSPPTPNVEKARSQPPRYRRKPEAKLTIAIPSEALPAPHVNAHIPCSIDTEHGKMAPNSHNRCICVEEINPDYVHGALPIQYISSNSVNGSERGQSIGRLPKPLSFPPVNPIVSSDATDGADSVEGLVSLDSLSASCSDSHDHATIAVSASHVQPIHAAFEFSAHYCCKGGK
jgi:hypothetical protein